MKGLVAIIALGTLVSGCAGFSGRGLVPGRSSAEEVEALMGPSADRRTGPGGETVRYYSRLPYGREMYAARFGPDGKLRAIEQRLTLDNVAKLRPGATRGDEVRDLLGPPASAEPNARMARQIWTYQMWGWPTQKVLYVQLSADNIVREVYLLDDRGVYYR